MVYVGKKGDGSIKYREYCFDCNIWADESGMCTKCGRYVFNSSDFDEVEYGTD